MTIKLRVLYENWDRFLREYVHKITETDLSALRESRAETFAVLLLRGWRRDAVGGSSRYVYTEAERPFAYCDIIVQRDPGHRYSEERVLWRDDRRAARRRLAFHRKPAERFELIAEIEAKAIDGRIYVQTGGRDCDQCEWTSPPHDMPADFRAYERLVASLCEDAEGPVWYWILAPEEIPRARHGSRDLALEAYEEGHISWVTPHGPLYPEARS